MGSNHKFCPSDMRGNPSKAFSVRDWSLIMGRGGGYKMENHGSKTFCAPPPLPVKTG